MNTDKTFCEGGYSLMGGGTAICILRESCQRYVELQAVRKGGGLKGNLKEIGKLKLAFHEPTSPEDLGQNCEIFGAVKGRN